MANELFIGTSGFFALLSQKDARHAAAHTALRHAQDASRRLVTTDHVLAETATLLKMRGEPWLARPLLERVFQSLSCRVEWTDEPRFHQVHAFFMKHADKRWSFADCVSFCIMKQLKIHEALTADRDFEQAGFQPLLK